MQNTLEASLIVQLISTLVQCGVGQDQIGVISLYRQQVKLLKHKLATEKHKLVGEEEKRLEEVEVLTADKSQGRDKDCIVVSLVRSNVDNQVRSPFPLLIQANG